jgi:hypothetical protein
MTVLYWTNPVRRMINGKWAYTANLQPTELHVTSDGARTVCTQDIPGDSAVVVAVTLDWHKHATCYNCVYQLWRDHAPEGYVRPVNGRDFPLRRECPHYPGRGLDPQSCPRCTPRPPHSPPALRQVSRISPGNPNPQVIRKWHIPSPYDAEMCGVCGVDIERGELINIEYEAGVMHASCSRYEGD